MIKKRQAGRRPKKARLRQWVCKPCWELKYCPYGPLVEFFPLHPEGQSVSSIANLHKRAHKEIAGAVQGSELDMLRAVEFFLYSEPDRWKWIKQFETKELGCSVFGHVCPVFFMAEPFTETKEGRRVGRRIPHEVMLKVVGVMGKSAKCVTLRFRTIKSSSITSFRSRRVVRSQPRILG